LTNAYNEVTQPRQQVAALQTQNESLFADAISSEKTSKELRVDLQVTTKKSSDLQKEKVKGQAELSTLTVAHADLADKYHTLSERFRAVESESRRKPGTIQSLSDPVTSADEELAALSANVDEIQAEIDHLKSAEIRLSKVNQIQDQSWEIGDLSPLRSEVQAMQESLAELQATYDRAQQCVKKLKPAAHEAESLKRKIAEFETAIGRLNEQVSENVRLKKTQRTT
jgi:chromosome segregation ATPase